MNEKPDKIQLFAILIPGVLLAIVIVRSSCGQYLEVRRNRAVTLMPSFLTADRPFCESSRDSAGLEIVECRFDNRDHAQSFLLNIRDQIAADGWQKHKGSFLGSGGEYSEGGEWVDEPVGAAGMTKHQLYDEYWLNSGAVISIFGQVWGPAAGGQGLIRFRCGPIGGVIHLEKPEF